MIIKKYQEQIHFSLIMLVIKTNSNINQAIGGVLCLSIAGVCTEVCVCMCGNVYALRMKCIMSGWYCNTWWKIALLFQLIDFIIHLLSIYRLLYMSIVIAMDYKWLNIAFHRQTESRCLAPQKARKNLKRGSQGKPID